MFSLEHYRALREKTGLVDRSERGRLRLTGPDRRSYLQGLLTNDISALTPGTGCYAALLTAQGRMICDMYVMETGEDIVMDLERDLTSKIHAHLERFVFTEDVQVIDESASLVQIGVFGPDAAAAAAAALEIGSARELDAMRVLGNRTVRWADSRVLLVRRDEIGVPGFDVIADRQYSGDIAAALRSAGAVDVDRESAEVTRVEGGVPAFLQDMNEDTIPLEAGIEDRAISHTKGCYVGQEVIIRVLHRGHGRVARRLVGLTLEPSAQVPTHGDRLRSADREIGAVTSAVRSPALDRPIALAYVHRDFVDEGTPVSVVSGESVATALVARLPFVAGLRETAGAAE
jgi:folate-binding protein YgfZ